MPHVCPSPSGQLAAAASAFRRARRKFPKNFGVCACSGDAIRTPFQIYSLIAKDSIPAITNIVTDPQPDYNRTTDRSLSSNPRGRRNYTSYQSLSSSRTALWSRDRRGQIIKGLNGCIKSEMVCVSCGKKHSHSQMSKSEEYDVLKSNEVPDSSKTSTVMSRRICARIKTVDSKESNQSLAETDSKSTHSSVGLIKRKPTRHRRPCLYSTRVRRSRSKSPKIQNTLQICHLHGCRDYNRKATTLGNLRPNERRKNVYCSDSPTLANFPTKLQTWERRTLQESLAKEDVEVAKRETIISNQETAPKHETPNLSRNREAIFKLHPNFVKKPPELISNTDFCLRPSLIKAAQRTMDLEDRERGKNCRKYGISGRKSKRLDIKSTWDENLNVINHKDSLSILMERFRGNDKQRSIKLQNIYELNSVLGSKISCCGEGEPFKSEKNNQANNQSLLQPFKDTESVEAHFSLSKSSSEINPVNKLGRVANQALRENESCFKNIRSRLNRTGICCSQKGTPWR